MGDIASQHIAKMCWAIKTKKLNIRMRALATYLLRGNKEAIIVVLVCSVLALIIPVFGLFNAVIIGLVSLRVGTNSGLMLSGISSAVIVLGILFVGVMPEESRGQELTAILQWVVSLLALVGLCAVLRYTRSLKLAMLSAMGAGIVSILGFRLFVSDTVAWWQHSAFKEFYNKAVESVMAQQSMVDHQMMEGISANLVGLFVSTFVASLFIHLFLARSWQAAMFNPGGFKEEYSQLAYGRNTAIFAIACFVLFMVLGAENLIGFVSMASVVLLGMMYTFYGIAVMVGVFKSKGWHLGMLFGGSFLLMVIGAMVLQPFVLSIIMMILVFAAVGFIDTVADFRKKVQLKSGQ